MEIIFSALFIFLYAFTLQSLPILLFKDVVFMRLLPLVMLLMPFSGIFEAVNQSPVLFPDTPVSRLGLFIPIFLGNILGWIAGLRFRKIIDREYTAFLNKHKEAFDKDNDLTD